jgi:hypothetical protein
MVSSVTPAGKGSGPRVLDWMARGGVAGGLALFLPLLVITLWLAVHRISGLAPWLADSLRAMVGVDAVARMEDVAYGFEDRFYSVWRRGEKPRAYWVVPAEPSRALPPAAAVARPMLHAPAIGGVAITPALPEAPQSAEPQRTVTLPPFRPHNVGPIYEALDAPGDGQWVKLGDGVTRNGARMYKTLLHPDAERAWAELFVVALDLRQLRVHLVPGTLEPQATLPEALDLPRPGRVPDEYHGSVIAAFNGGFKTEHGHYGTHANGVTLVPPLPGTCTIALFKDNTLRIATWSKLQPRAGETLWWRQTPDCMYEDGKINPRLAGGLAGKWGSSLDGETVVRRSAMGIDAAGTTLFVGISNHTTAPAIARGMHHAGAATVAQLDINFSYPKFLTFRESSASKLRVAVPLAAGFEYSEHEYLRRASPRDFFYVMDTSVDGRTARN